MAYVTREAFERAARCRLDLIAWTAVIEWARAAGYATSPESVGGASRAIRAGSVEALVAEWRIAGAPGVYATFDDLVDSLL